MRPFEYSIYRAINSQDPKTYYENRLKAKLGSRSGADGWYKLNCLCPFHSDKRVGSLYINIRTGAFKCHSCGAKGGSIANFETLLIEHGYNSHYVWKGEYQHA